MTRTAAGDDDGQGNGQVLGIAVVTLAAFAPGILLGWGIGRLGRTSSRLWAATSHLALSAVLAPLSLLGSFEVVRVALEAPVGAALAWRWALLVAVQLPIATASAFGYLALYRARLRMNRVDPAHVDRVDRARIDGTQRRALRHASRLPLTVDTRDGVRSVLGVYIEGTLDKHAWRRRLWRPTGPLDLLVLDPEGLPHLIAAGASGSGKTQSLLRLAQGCASEGWCVLYFDGKGSTATRNAFASAMAAVGRQARYWPEEPYDAFRGSAAEQQARLMSYVDFTEPFESAWVPWRL